MDPLHLTISCSKKQFSRFDVYRGGVVANPDLDALSAEKDVEVQESGDIGRFGGYIPNLGNVPDLKTAAFKLNETNRLVPEVYTVDGDAVVAMLAEKIPAGDEQLETDKDRIVQRLRAQKEAMVVAEFIKGLRDRSAIELGQGYSFDTTDATDS